MYRRIGFFLIICGLSFWVTACGSSEELIVRAQQKYRELARIHNQAVNAHQNISDNSLDEDLLELSEKEDELEQYNLTEMKDEEIEQLIQNMDSMIDSYDDMLEKLSDIKTKEDAAIRIPVPVTINNNSSFSFSELKLYEKGDAGIPVNVLEGMDCLAAGQTLTGLLIQKDVDDTPWMLFLCDMEGTAYEFEIPVSEYGEDGITLKLIYDAEESALVIEYEE